MTSYCRIRPIAPASSESGLDLRSWRRAPISVMSQPAS
jgi:hypothetical protein